MSPARDRFLQRVRQAVAAGNRAGAVPALRGRGQVGYQGAGAVPAERFCAEFATAGGLVYRVPDRAAARRQVLELVQARSSPRILLGGGAVLDSLDLPGPLRGLGAHVTGAHTLPAEACRDPFFAADVGISGVDYLVAETGSLVFLARPDEPRSLSLLPPVHIAVAKTGQLLPDLFDLFALFSQGEAGPRLPSCLTLVTGPSKTGDIELRLVTGVHGPGEVHLVLIGAAVGYA